MEAPKEIIRTTLGEYMSIPIYQGAGIYIVACCPFPGILYVGKTEQSIYSRLKAHMSKADGALYNFFCGTLPYMPGYRLDILIPPNNDNRWLLDVEEKLIAKFSPFCNTRYMRRGYN